MLTAYESVVTAILLGQTYQQSRGVSFHHTVALCLIESVSNGNIKVTCV